MNKQPLIIPIGIPASGKTTARQSLISNGVEVDAVVSPDDFRCALTGNTEDQTANKAVFEIVDKIVYSRINRGLRVYVDATNLLPAKRTPYVDFAADKGVPVIYLRLDTPYEECVRRNAERLRQVPIHVMERMQKNFDQFCGVDALTAELGDSGLVLAPNELMIQHIFR